MAKLSQMEGALSGSLGRLFALNENYPELKSDQTMMQLQEELVSTENKISYARQFYNDTVMDYNTRREIFPHSLISGMFHFNKAGLWEIKDSVERQNVKVSF
jgi:LemA protein